MSRKDRVSQELRFRVLSELMRVAASSLDIRETFEAVGEWIKELIDYDRLAFAGLDIKLVGTPSQKTTGQGTADKLDR